MIKTTTPYQLPHYKTLKLVVESKSISRYDNYDPTKCVEWFYKRREVTTAWEAQGLIFSHKVTELIKHHGDNGRTYDVVPLDWGINYYDIYNKNRLIETVIFYTYIIFLFNFKI
jgi:hypothetical protein